MHRRAASPTAALTALAMIGVSTPVFLLGAVMLYLLGLQARAVPERRLRPADHEPGPVALPHDPALDSRCRRSSSAFYSRVLRSNVLDTMNEDYVRTARAKGTQPSAAILVRHVLRNSLIPIVSLWGLDFAAVDRRRRDPHRVGIQPPRRRPVRGAVDRAARRAAGARDRDVRVVLRRAAERRHRHRDGGAGPADQAPIAARASARRG